MDSPHPIRYYIWLDIEESQCTELNIADISFLTKSIKQHACFNAVTISNVSLKTGLGLNTYMLDTYMQHPTKLFLSSLTFD